MISKLILVRHGKAQDRANAEFDEQRKLTSAGKRAWRAHCTRVLAPLFAGEELCLWSSPAIRAKQTAEILAGALGVQEIEEHPELYSGDIDALTEALKAATGCVVLVGHEPFMSDYSAQLDSAARLPFGKGATAAFSLAQSEGPESALQSAHLPADLLWFVQGPETARWKTLDQLEDGLAKAAKRIEEASARLCELPDDVEALHKYRISLRVARSLLSFARPWLKDGYRKSLDANLRGLQAPTSRVREMDILVQELEQGSAAAMVAARERYEVRIGFIDAFLKSRTQKALRQACKALCRAQWRSCVEERGLGRAEIAWHFSDLQEAQDQMLESLDYADQEAVHTIRKKAKALRYAARENASCLSGASQVSERMESVQDQLGALCDAWVNEALMARLPCEEASALAAAQRARADEIIAELEAQRASEGI